MYRRGWRVRRNLRDGPRLLRRPRLRGHQDLRRREWVVLRGKRRQRPPTEAAGPWRSRWWQPGRQPEFPAERHTVDHFRPAPCTWRQRQRFFPSHWRQRRQRILHGSVSVPRPRGRLRRGQRLCRQFTLSDKCGVGVCLWRRQPVPARARLLPHNKSANAVPIHQGTNPVPDGVPIRSGD